MDRSGNDSDKNEILEVVTLMADHTTGRLDKLFAKRKQMSVKFSRHLEACGADKLLASTELLQA